MASPNQVWVPADDTAITAGGTSQRLFAANTRRRGFLLQNQSSGDLWINFGVAAVADVPSIKVAAGETIVMEVPSPVDTRDIYVIGATTGQKFTAKEV